MVFDNDIFMNFLLFTLNLAHPIFRDQVCMAKATITRKKRILICAECSARCSVTRGRPR